MPTSPWNYSYTGTSTALVAYSSGTAGLPTFGAPGTDFPNASHGYIVPTGGAAGSSTSNDSAIWSNSGTIANAVYWFAPGTHYGSHQIFASDSDAFVGAPGAVINGSQQGGGILGNGANVTIQYLTLQKIGIPVDGQGWAALNSNLSSGWVMTDDTVTGTGDAGINTGSLNVVKNDCLTNNGQAGVIGYGGYGSVIENNEVSFNDPLTGGKIDYPNSPIGCGCAGGIKILNDTNDTISGNYVHDNGDAGIWLDTNNAGITLTSNYVSNNVAHGIFYEASYDGLINNNLLVDNSLASNSLVAQYHNLAAALYIANSGSVPTSTGLSATPYCVSYKTCPATVQPTCAGSTLCQTEFDVTNNTFVNNWDAVNIYTDDTRNVAYCPSGTPAPGQCAETTPSGHVGTDVGGSIWGSNTQDPQGIVPCYNAQGSAQNSSPNYWLACVWPDMGIKVTGNVLSTNPATINAKIAAGSPQCTTANLCGFNGLYAFDGGCCEAGNYNPGNGYQPSGCPSGGNPPFVCRQSQNLGISYDWGNSYANNSYYGPWSFWAWDQSDQNLPYSWSMWTGPLARCPDGNSNCANNFGQDAGSTLAASGGPGWNFTG
jgi:parallel beta-helix repeat protein